MTYLSEIISRFMSWAKEEKGQTLVEYGLILALISIAAILVMPALGTSISDVFVTVTNAINGA